MKQSIIILLLQLCDNNFFLFLPLQQLQKRLQAGRHIVQQAEGRSNHILNMLC